MPIKLDMGKAWNDAVALLSANKDVILIVAGVFFFLPNAISALAIPQPTEIEAMTASGAQPDLEAMSAIMMSYYAQNWWIFVLLGLVQAIGMLGLLALLTDTSRPTVGEALGFGVKALLPYLGTQILLSLIVVSVVLVLIGLGSLIGPALAVLLGIVSFVVMVYLIIKFSLASPVIAIEKVMNPFRVLQRSWQLTKGNSFRLLGFYSLLVLVLVVVSLVAGLVFAAFGIFGEQVGLFAAAIGGAVLSMAMTAIMLAVLAAIHRQLTGGSAEAMRETFG